MPRFLLLASVFVGRVALSQPSDVLAEYYVAYADLRRSAHLCVEEHDERMCRRMERLPHPDKIDLAFEASPLEPFLCYSVISVTTFATHSSPWLVAVDANSVTRLVYSPDRDIPIAVPSCGLAKALSTPELTRNSIYSAVRLLNGGNPFDVAVDSSTVSYSTDDIGLMAHLKVDIASGGWYGSPIRHESACFGVRIPFEGTVKVWEAEVCGE
ncbi:MAG: hypothetical protein R2832_10460 [Rhodothermales bacterium]